MPVTSRQLYPKNTTVYTIKRMPETYNGAHQNTRGCVLPLVAGGSMHRAWPFLSHPLVELPAAPQAWDLSPFLSLTVWPFVLMTRHFNKIWFVQSFSQPCYPPVGPICSLIFANVIFLHDKKPSIINSKTFHIVSYMIISIPLL